MVPLEDLYRALDDPLKRVPAEVVDALTRVVRDIRFGSIEIVIHEGRITQIERREKLRLVQPTPTRRE